MKRTVLLCLACSFFGAVLAIALTRGQQDRGVTAQEDLPPKAIDDPGVRSARFPRTDGTRLAVASAPTTDAKDFTPEEQVNIAVYENTNRGVVNITTQSARADSFFFQEVPTKGSGSGSVLDKEGHILTNYHVISGAREINVTLWDGISYDAGIVGQDPQNDIAVLRIKAPEDSLFPVSIGDSTHLKVGQKVFAIGNPFGLERTLTVGIISSLNRSLRSQTGRTMKSIIQLDAALNSGNSGGPLLNSKARLIGMNTAIASPSGTGENTGIGFAVPAATIRRVVPELIEHGKVTRADVGIARVYETERGLVVAALSPGGPAEKAGLRGFRIVRRQRREGSFIYEERRVDRSYADLITAIDGKSIRTADQLLDIVESKRPGDRVSVSIIRDDKETNVAVVLGEEE